MKFWKSLSNLIDETLPDWRDKFLSYKDLKKQLKLIYPKDKGVGEISVDDGVRPNKRLRSTAEIDGPDSSVDNTAGDTKEDVAKAVIDFGKRLEEEVEKFNSFFVDKEEEYIIRLKVLQDKVAEGKDSNEELMKVGREIVDFHGEMVLLENYSSLNYTGLVKILKKYDKQTGALIRLPFIQKVLEQPFFKTDILRKLVNECEAMLNRIFSLNELSVAPFEATTGENRECSVNTVEEIKEIALKVPEELQAIRNVENMYMKLTTSALRVLKEIRSGSSTVSMFSLPPLQSNNLVEVWKEAPVLEQEAK